MTIKLPNSSDDTDFDFSDVQDSNIKPLEVVGAKILKPPKNLISSIEVSSIDQIEKQKVESNFILSPGFQLNGEKLKIVKFTSDLLINLDLMVKFDFLKVVPSFYNFDETLSYDQSKREVFRKIVLNKGGYLLEDSNFFEVDQSRLSPETKLTTIRNSRVSLFWRGVELTEVNVKRILTLGLAFLLGIISQAELVLEIKQEIKNDNYLISIKIEKNTYVRIGIETPVFSY